MSSLYFVLSAVLAHSLFIGSKAETTKRPNVEPNIVPIKNAPFQAIIESKDDILCNAVIIHELWMLSVASCFHDTGRATKDLYTRVGSSTGGGDGETFKIKKVIIHPEVNFTTFDNNIALIQLEKPIKFNEYKQPISITQQNEVLKVGQELKLYGNGRTKSEIKVGFPSILREFDFKVIDSLKCSSTNGNRITDSMFCAESKLPVMYISNRGGPAFVNGKLVGLFLIYNNSHGSPGIFIRIDMYYDWIVQSTTNINYNWIKKVTKRF